MGKKRDSVRTLPSGEKVVHHPDGEQDLIKTGRMARRLASDADETSEAVAALRRAALDRVAAKAGSLDEGDAVPHDKRPL